MRIAIDTTAMPANRAGAGVYTYQLTRALTAALPDGDHLAVFDRWGAFDDLEGPNLRLYRVALGGRGRRLVWEQTELPRTLHAAGVQVFHSPHHSLPAVRQGWRNVVTIHDVTFRLLPWRYTPARRIYMSAVTALASVRADAIIVPSASVKRDFLRLYCGRADRVTVIPEAAPPSMRVIEDCTELGQARERLGLPERFILSVGTLEPGKNRGALVQALAHLRARGLPHRLVVVGQRGWGAGHPEPEAERLGIADAVNSTGYVDDADLPRIYNLADAFVFPSWREGFGLPPLEAMACGTPVVSSDRPAMPEILGDAALYAPPGRPDLIADALEQVLTDDSLHERMRARGLEQASRYSWERAANETLAVYRRV
jgi:glycosyltransferase involved in cell wall biosynthesis